jgi:hypothetical protein
MANFSIMIIISILAKWFVRRYKKYNPHSTFMPFVCVGCMAFWMAAITLPFFSLYELIFPTYLIAVIYDNQTMA